MRALVTGYMGILGRSVSRQLKKRGWWIHGCDSRAGTPCEQVFEANNLHYDLVIHAAKLKDDEPFFEWVNKTKPARVVYFSGADAYPMELQNEPYRLIEHDIDPANLLLPGSMFGGVKLSGELLAAKVDSSETKVYVFRPFEVYGEAEGKYSVFREIATKVANREDPFVIQGCGRVLDYVHVADATEAVMRTLDHEIDLFPAMNLCTGIATAVDDLAIQMFDYLKWEPKVLQCEGTSPQYFRCGDPSIMSLAWIPRVSLQEGIRREFPSGSRYNLGFFVTKDD